MKKINLVSSLAIMLSIFSITIFGTEWSYSNSGMTVNYKDYRSEYAAESTASVKAGTKVAACVGVRDAGLECGPLLSGKASKMYLPIAEAYWNKHVHCIIDQNGNKSFIK